MHKLYKILLIGLVFLSASVYAQKYTVSGMVTNVENGEKLPGANVYMKALNTGAVTNADGIYSIGNVPKGTYELTVSYVGYISEVSNIYVGGDVSLNFNLKPSPVLLGETVVKGTRATLRETPVAFTEVKGEDIEFRLSSRDLPQVLNVTPSLYSSPGGGGAGDANLVIRGFNQRNIAIMINGVPVNDMENGWVYWSNWAGLGNVTQDIQIQRGLGASPYSVSSIGGVVNVQTFGASGRKEFSKLSTEFGSDNLSKTTFAFSSMITSNIGMTGLVSRKVWDGYANGLYLNEFTYFFSIGGVFGKHSVEFTGVGSPQEHGQRVTRQTIDSWNQRGFDYNKNYGFLFGQPLNEVVNKYHKPQFNLNWNWQLNQSSILSTVGYFSFGTGYGSGRLGSNFIYNTAGLIDFDAVWARNEANLDSNGVKQSLTILRNSVNNHFWTGILSTYKTNVNDELSLSVGFDGRYYLGEHYREIRNLLGGSYWLNTKDINNPDLITKTGDLVDYHNDGKVMLYGGFAQAEYQTGKISTFLNVSASNTGYQRIDYFNFLNSDPAQTTEWQTFLGYTAKTGLNFNIDEHNNVFANVGYFSKAPIFDNVFDFSNNVFADATNEKILGIELGYGLSTPLIALNINGYYTDWKDRAINAFFVYTAPDESTVDYQANIKGAEQKHIGVELESRIKPTNTLEFGLMLSVSDAKFQNDVNARLYPEEDPSQVTEIHSYVKDLYVSEFPMTRASFDMLYRYELGNGSTFIFNPIYNFFGRQYAFFNPDARTNPDDLAQSWRLPDFYLFDVHTAYEILFTNFFVKKATVGLHIFNALNTKNYITDATDGSDHTQYSATVWYGRERWYNLSFTFDL
ncbi:MAG: TonB-dependent receptor [Ignavibacteriales bacterium]|nr:TonB-dependent receptor [Ignavibacteriales bacterium]